jgi:hypothetical protein
VSSDNWFAELEAGEFESERRLRSALVSGDLVSCDFVPGELVSGHERLLVDHAT